MTSPGTAGQNAKPHAWKDKHIVALPNRDRVPVIGHLGERAACRNQGPAFGPGNQICWHCFAFRCWVGQRKDDGTLDVAGHLAHDGFREHACLGGGPNQDGWMHVFHNLLQSRRPRCLGPFDDASLLVGQRMLSPAQDRRARCGPILAGRSARAQPWPLPVIALRLPWMLPPARQSPLLLIQPPG